MMFLTETGPILEGSCAGGVKAVLDKVRVALVLLYANFLSAVMMALACDCTKDDKASD